MSLSVKQKTIFLLLFLSSFCGFSQEVKRFRDSVTAIVDSLYREDQFYLAMTFNTLQDMPSGFSQQGISYGFNVGFQRDMPINKRRNLAIAAGVGLSYNRYNHNLFATDASGEVVYSGTPEANYSNGLDQYLFEFPIEFRWRGSTPKVYKFWRLYTGVKVGYLFYSKSTYESSKMTEIVNNNPDLNKIPVGLQLSVGYNTWNFHVYYGLSPMYKSGTVNGQSLYVTTFNLGTIFYML